MMPLAASGIELTVALVVAAIFWIFKLVSGLANAGGSTSMPKPPPMPSQPAQREGGIREVQERRMLDSEEERTRKFLEALGLPSDTLQRKPPQGTMRTGETSMRQPGGVPSAPPSLPRGVPPVPTFGGGVPTQPTRAQIEQARLERKKRQAQQQQPRIIRLPDPEPESRPYDGAIERIHLAELKTSAVPELKTRTSDVSAIPFELAESVAGQVYRKAGSIREAELVALARSPEALRQAILLREILGPPRSLQSDFAAPNMAPL